MKKEEQEKNRLQEIIDNPNYQQMIQINRIKGTYSGTCKKMLIKLMRAGVEQGVVPKVSELKKEFNFIDVYPMVEGRNLGDKNTDSYPPPVFTDELKEFVRKSVYGFMPVYETQLIRLNKHCYRLVSLSTIKEDTVHEVIGKESFSGVAYFLTVDCFGFFTEVKQWGLDGRYTAFIIVDRDEDGDVVIRCSSMGNKDPEHNFIGVDYYVDKIDASKVDFTDSERRIWDSGLYNEYIDNYLRDEEADEQFWRTDVINISYWFAVMNMLLTKNKAKAVRGKEKKKAEVKYNKDLKGEPKRKIKRVLDNRITIVSEKPPRAFEGKKIIEYKVAKWNRRGYVRHLKSGKTVYIQPAVCHRKKLIGIENEQDVRKTDLVFESKKSRIKEGT